MVILAMTWVPATFGAVSPEEAAKLGTTLTQTGAEKAGNKEGMIPPYTGGLTKPPANYVASSAEPVDPFAGEKPLFSINAQNMAQYAGKLTEGTKDLLKRFPTFRIDVYKTHRTIAFPDYVIKNTVINAVKATTANGGLSMKNAHAGIPFPIPKDGYEVMWNHLTHYQGRAWESSTVTDLVDSSGRMIPVGGGVMVNEYPYYDEGTPYDPDIYWKIRWFYNRPARKIGEAGLLFDPVNMAEKGRIVYQYLPGQRRVKLAPEVAFDTPNFDSAGSNVHDESFIFCGSMERYDMKLIEKKELYVPYNVHKVYTRVKNQEEVLGPKHLNPDAIRWELHRMWVVEATLKQGKRHCYPKRRFYIDEDSWTALACENYDNGGKIAKIGYTMQIQHYVINAPCTKCHVFFNIPAGCYTISFWHAAEGYHRKVNPLPQRDYSPDAIAGRGIR
jgi:hypothetical protein